MTMTNVSGPDPAATDSCQLAKLDADGEPEQCGTEDAACAGARRPGLVSWKLRHIQMIGGGGGGLVQRALDVETGQILVVKRLERQATCPFLFVTVARGTGCGYRDDERTFRAEGLSPQRAPAIAWSGPLVFHPENDLAVEPFASGSLAGSVLLARRGGATFSEKLANAQAGGAAGVIFVNAEDRLDAFSVDTCSPALHSLMLSSSDGEEIIRWLGEEQATALCAVVRTQVEQELDSCSALPLHENLVRVFAVREEPTAAIAFELLRGSTLSGLRVGQELALRLVRQALSGVRHMHRHGFCHRDLQPCNMMLSAPVGERSARLVLIDLGMASRSGRMYATCGSLRYLAPEVLAGSGYGMQRDLWSVGVVAHELLAGRHPLCHLRDEPLVDWLKDPSASCPVLCGLDGVELPGTVQALLCGLLEKAPEKRLTAQQALDHPALALALST